MRFLAYFVLTAAVAAGCGDTAAPTGPQDASVDPDCGLLLPNCGVDAGADGGVDAGVDAGVDGGGSWCETSALCPACPDMDALCDSENP
ncbi:MAG: hypothetical protein WBN29_13190, partial [Polyangiales bacterium]